jgi:hypothetical protein
MSLRDDLRVAALLGQRRVDAREPLPQVPHGIENGEADAERRRRAAGHRALERNLATATASLSWLGKD